MLPLFSQGAAVSVAPVPARTCRPKKRRSETAAYFTLWFRNSASLWTFATGRRYPSQPPTSGTGNGIKGMQPARNNV